MLAALQKHLADIYQVDCGERISDYLITDRILANCIADQPLDTGVEETVLVSEDNEGMGLSVFLDQDLLTRLEKQNPLNGLRARRLGDLATVLEGISHFNYLVWSAQQDRSVTLLELELQAEIDKFVATTLLALDQQDYEFVRRLHHWLFDEVTFHTSLNDDQRQRYEIANDYAGRFCHRVFSRIGAESGFAELRLFYRLTQAEKIGYIQSLAWGRH
jgi:hypothetical protein